MSKLLTEQDFIDSAKRLGCEVAAVKAVAKVESSGGGFDPEGFPKTLFEGHWFSRYTKGKFDATNPTISYPKWTKQFYGKTWQTEKARLNTAISLDRTSALMSASWGMFQVMGFNFGVCGFTNVQDFVTKMCEGEGGQLECFASYVLRNGLDKKLKTLDWDGFAYGYNGPEYKKNDYGNKLMRAYTSFK